MEKYNLKGFYTGMIVSEFGEAQDWILHPCTIDQIDKSNELFAASVEKSLDQEDILSEMMYGYVGEDNVVIDFNRENLFYI